MSEKQQAALQSAYGKDRGPLRTSWPPVWLAESWPAAVVVTSPAVQEAAEIVEPYNFRPTIVPSSIRFRPLPLITANDAAQVLALTPANLPAGMFTLNRWTTVAEPARFLRLVQFRIRQQQERGGGRDPSLPQDVEALLAIIDANKNPVTLDEKGRVRKGDIDGRADTWKPY